MPEKKILFISNHAAFFYSHRFNLFKESKRRNIKFKLIFGNSASKKMETYAIKKLRKNKVKFTNINYSHNKFNLILDILAIIKIVKIIKNYKPNIIHSASPKANFISAILVLFVNIDKLILSISGLGYLFTEKKKNYLLNLKKFLFSFIIRKCIKK